MKRVWREVPDPESTRSLFNSGWRYGVCVAGSGVLLCVVSVLCRILLGVLGVVL